MIAQRADICHLPISTVSCKAATNECQVHNRACFASAECRRCTAIDQDGLPFSVSLRTILIHYPNIEVFSHYDRTSTPGIPDKSVQEVLEIFYFEASWYITAVHMYTAHLSLYKIQLRFLHRFLEVAFFTRPGSGLACRVNFPMYFVLASLRFNEILCCLTVVEI